MRIDGDADAYRAVLAEARRGDAAVEDLREPMDDRTFTVYAAPLYALQERPGEVEEYEEDGATVREVPDGPAYHPAEDAYTVDGEMLTDIHTGMTRGPSGLAARTRSALVTAFTDYNPFHHYGRHRAVMDLPLDGDPGEASVRYHRRGALAALGGAAIGAGAAAAALAGGMLDAPLLQQAGETVFAADAVGQIPVQGYYVGAAQESKELGAAQTANGLVDEIGDSALRVEPENNAVEGFFDALDPDAETPDWLDRLEK